MRKAIVCLFALFVMLLPANVMARNYGDGSYGLGNYNEGEPTPTPTATPTPTTTSTSTSSNSNSSTSTPNCNDSAPAKPELFQVDIKGTSAKLFFTPLQDTNKFYVSFSTKSNAEEHGVEVTLAKEGVQNYTVNALKPNTTYYFKIRGQNGCMPGGWSNIVKITSKSAGITKTISYYMNSLKTKVTSVFSTIKLPKVKTTTPTTISKEPIQAITPTSQRIALPVTNNQEAVKQLEKKRFCILWWCW